MDTLSPQHRYRLIAADVPVEVAVKVLDLCNTVNEASYRGFQAETLSIRNANWTESTRILSVDFLTGVLLRIEGFAMQSIEDFSIIPDGDWKPLDDQSGTIPA